jgi:hypothetical protein
MCLNVRGANVMWASVVQSYVLPYANVHTRICLVSVYVFKFLGQKIYHLKGHRPTAFSDPQYMESGQILDLEETFLLLTSSSVETPLYWLIHP